MQWGGASARTAAESTTHGPRDGGEREGKEKASTTKGSGKEY